MDISFLAVLSALAAEPVLGPDGWTWPGPWAPSAGSPRGWLGFDPRTCGIEVGMVDLDGGPGFADVRLARGVIGGKEVWLDDWSVVDGQLLRPGRDPVVLARAGVAVEVDELGRVVARARDGRRLEILRADDGSFLGMRAGSVSVRLDGDGAVASDGRKVRYVREDGRISSLTDPAGRRTR